MNVAAPVDALQQVFIQLILAFEAEADKAHLNFGSEFKARVFETERFKLLGEADVTTNVGLKVGIYLASTRILKVSISYLKIFNSIKAKNKPKLECSESSSQWNLPMTIVWRRSLLVVLEIKWVNVEGVHNPFGVFQPHRRAVEVDEQPFMWVEVERFSVFNTLHPVSVFWADES